MIAEERISKLEENNPDITSFANELDEKLMLGEIDLVEYGVMMNEKHAESARKELRNEMDNETSHAQAHNRREKKNKIQLGIAGAILVVIALISIFSQQGLLTPTGFITGGKQVQQAIDFNQTFSKYTETQLELGNMMGLKISGKLEGTGAKVKLRINGTDYLVADIINPATQNQTTPEQTPQYIISTDKRTYSVGEAVTIIITPETENKSIYISYGNETKIIEGNSYNATETGEHQAIALIVLPDNILRLETNFTVSNETAEQNPGEPEPTVQETASYEFSSLCVETCNIPETSDAILIIEPAENSILTITQITAIQIKENQAPEQIRVISDIAQTTQQATTLDLNEYFSDPDADTIQYDINEIPEIDATISQNILTIASANPGVYTAYIYATDGDKLVTSNTFTIAITSATTETPTETNQTTNETTNGTNLVILEISNLCSDPNPNKRPIECLDNAEYFQEQTILIENTGRAPVARITPIGNLIISGDVIEQDNFVPTEGDYTIGYEDSYGNKQTTVWFESSTGNVHLKGNLYEEKINSEPAPGNFVIRNKKGIILIWGDSITGDMYIRGNVISNRKNIMR